MSQNKNLGQLTALAAADAASATLQTLVRDPSQGTASNRTKSITLDKLRGGMLRLGNVFDVSDPQFGAKVDDSTDDTAAIQTAINAAAAGTFPGTVVIPGKCKVSATANTVPGASGNYALLVPAGVSVIGVHRTAQIRCATDAATIIAAAGSSSASHVTDVTIGGLTIVGGDLTNNGLGRGVFFFRADRCRVIGCNLSAMRLGIQIDRSSGDSAYNVGCSVNDTIIHDTFGTSTGNGSGFFASGVDGLVFSAIQSLNVAEHGMYLSQDIRNVVVDGFVSQPAVNTNGNCCLQIFTASNPPNIQHITLGGLAFKGGKYGLLASASGGGKATHLTLSDSVISGCLSQGVYLSNVSHSTIAAVTATGITNGTGIQVDAGQYVNVVGCISDTNGLHGLMLNATTDSQVIGGVYLNNDQLNTGNYGIRLASTSTGCSVRGALCKDDQGGPTQDYGLAIDAAASNADIDNVTFAGNALGPIATFGATGTRIRNCRGYNPVGVSTIAVGASPFTYTAGSSPETVSIYGGAVSSITKSGTQIASATGQQIPLYPGESIVVTYTSGPAMVRDVQ